MKFINDGQEQVEVFYKNTVHLYNAKNSVASVELALKTELGLYSKWDVYLVDDVGYMPATSFLGCAVGNVYLKIDKHFVPRRLWSTGEFLEVSSYSP